HRIRHYGLLANGSRRADLAKVRQALQVEPKPAAQDAVALATPAPVFVCRHCAGPMQVVQTFLRAQTIRGPPTS
ncbi:IS91 family transposase, partial [Ideonella sp. 4Y11]|nr:IS91 family transposase [Ideonella aquatica]